MPYANLPESEWDKMDRCVEEVQAKGHDKQSAIAICYTSITEGKSVDDVIAASLENLKIGARNSARDQERLQSIHDFAVENGAKCAKPAEVVYIPMKADETVVTFGDAIKATETAEGVKLGGYLVRFTTAQDPDLSEMRDFFTKETDYDVSQWPAHSTVYFNHGVDRKIGKRKLGLADLTQDEVGIWAETILQERDEYEKAIADLGRAGKLGWSSGTASHLVERQPEGKANRITRWPLGLDASLTHKPAEPRNIVSPLKSISDSDILPDDITREGAEAARETAPINGIAASDNVLEVKGTTMDITQEKLEELISAAAAKGAEQALKSLPPEPVKAGNVAVTHDEADYEFKSLAEQCRATKTATLTQGRKLDPRLTRLEIKAPTGAEEGVLSEGGYLLEPTLVGEFLQPVHEVGPFSSRVRKLPVQSNSNYGWINGVDETSRAVGYRWGGIRGYRLSEGDSVTASQPKFRRINWELKKMGVLVYGTDELLADAAQFSTVVRTGASEELNFMANDDILNGTGIGGPLGVLNAGCLISVSAETSQLAATVIYENLVNMWARLDSRSKANSAWYINTDVNPQLDALALASGTGVLEPRFIAYDQAGVMRIKGRPVIETEFNATLGTVGDIVLADMSQYLFWEKAGIEAASSIHVQFVTDQQVFRFIYRCDGQPALASALTPYKGTNTTSPFVALATRS